MAIDFKTTPDLVLGQRGDANEEEVDSNADLVKQVFDNWTQVRNDRENWVISALKCESFVNGKQWSSAERSALKAKGQPDYVDNRLYPAVQSLVSSIVGKSPTFFYTSRSGQDVTFLNDIQTHILHISKFSHVHRKLAESCIVHGVGYAMVYKDDDANYGSGEVKVNYISIRDVYVPKCTRAADFSDAPEIYYSKLLSKETFENIYNVSADECSWMYDESYMDYPDAEADTKSSYGDVDAGKHEQDKQYVRIIVRYRKIKVERKVIFDELSGHKKVTDIDYKLSSEEQEAFDQGIYSVKNIFVTKVEEVVIAGDTKFISKRILNIKEYPIVAIVFIDTESPYPLSLVHLLEGQQKLVNKAHSIVLYNALLGSSIRYIGPVGIFGKSPEQKKQWMDNVAQPGGCAEYYPTIPGEHPIELRPEPLNNAFYSILTDARHTIEYLSGQFPMMRGDPSEAPRTWRATANIHEWGMGKLALFFNSLDLFFNTLASVMLSLIGETYVYPRILTLQQEQDQKQVPLNVPKQVEDGFEVANDVFGAAMDADVAIKPGSYAPTYKSALVALLTELASTGAPVIDLIIQNLDIPQEQKDVIVQRIQSQGDVKQLSEAMQKMQKEQEQLAKSNQDLENQIEVERTKADLAVLEERKRNEVEVVRLQEQLRLARKSSQQEKTTKKKED